MVPRDRVGFGHGVEEEGKRDEVGVGACGIGKDELGVEVEEEEGACSEELGMDYLGRLEVFGWEALIQEMVKEL